MLQVTDGHAIRTRCGRVSTLFKVEGEQFRSKRRQIGVQWVFLVQFADNFTCFRVVAMVRVRGELAAEMFGYVLVGCVGLVIEGDRLVKIFLRVFSR